jgi:hypothetical protein
LLFCLSCQCADLFCQIAFLQIQSQETDGYVREALSSRQRTPKQSALTPRSSGRLSPLAGTNVGRKMGDVNKNYLHLDEMPVGAW